MKESCLITNKKEMTRMSPGFMKRTSQPAQMYISHKCEIAVWEQTNDTRVGAEGGGS